jgi:uncharacterized repeat protein (TIGR01451 family)
MQNTKLLLILVVYLFVNPTNNLSASDDHSFASFKAESSEKFNPFILEDDLGSTTDSNFAGSSFFFGDADDSLWGGSGNASGAPDGLVASTFVFPGKQSRYLLVRDFGLNIPCNAEITDISFNVTRRNNSSVDAADVEVRLFNPVTLDFSALNNADPNIWLEGGGFETVTYSDATWGETLRPEILNDSRFGLILSVANLELAGRSEAYVDAVEISVCYNVGTVYPDPITITTAKVDACFDQGSITVSASGGSGTYEYSNDNGATFQASNVFDNLPFGDYIVTVRNSDGTCQTANFYCNVSGDDRILQAGDMVVACSTYPGSRVTLAVEKAQPFNDFFNDGIVGTDVSQFLPVHPFEWTVSDLGGEVFSSAFDQERNIYTAVTTLYDLVPGTGNISPTVSKIDAFTGAVTQYNTLPGSVGAAAVEYDTICNNLYVANLEDGNIYRLDPDNGAVLSSFDPLNPDDGSAGYAPLGERVVAVTYNYADNRLYYSVWNSDFNMSGIKNTIRSVAIDPGSCDFLPATDQLELEQPWLSEYGEPTNPDNYNMPVGDIEFSTDGMSMLLAEVGFDTDASASKPHESRVLLYTGTSANWTLDTNVPAGNTNLVHEVGEVSEGLNARGGVDFANSGFDADQCAIQDDQFIVSTADALRGANCNTFGCIYGIQYLPVTGGNSANSVILDIGRDFSTQLKSVFGDVDVVKGCQESVFCCPTITATPDDETICPGDTASTVTASTETDSLALVYLPTLATDSTIVYSNGIKIDSVETVGGSATLSLDNLPTTPGTYYVYIVAHPTPAGDYCRPNEGFVVTVATPTTVEVSGSTFVCVADDAVTFTGTPAPTAGMTMGVFTTTATAGLTNNNDGTASFNPTMADVGTYDITYTFTDADGCPSSATTSIEVDPCFEFDLSLSKTVTSTGPYMPGSTLTYDIVVTNDGDLEGVNIDIEDVAPAGITFVSSNAGANANITENTPGSYTIASVPVNGSETISLTYTIDMTFMGTSITNTAQITSDNGDDRDSDPDSDDTIDDLDDGLPDDDEDSVTTNVGQNYDLALDIVSTTMGPLSSGDNVTFQIEVTNEGSLVGNNIEVLNVAPPGLIYVSDDSGTDPNVTATVNGGWVLGTLSPGENSIINVTYQIDPAFMGMILNNSAEITIDDGDDVDSDPDSSFNSDDLADGVEDDDEGTVMVMIGQVYDLALTKNVISTGPYFPNGTITYELTLSNDGTLDASGIEITDNPPAGLTYVSSNATTNSNVTETTPGVWLVSNIAAQTQETIEVTFQIDATFMGTSLSNSVEITADDGDDVDSDPDSDDTVDDLDDGLPDDDEDSIEVNIGQVFDLALTEDVVGPTVAVLGDQVTFSITVSNQGSLDATDVTFTDTPGPGLTFVSSSAPSLSNGTVAGVTSWTLPNLPSMTSQTIEVTYSIDNNFTGMSVTTDAEIIAATGGTDIDSDPDSGPGIDDLNDGVEDDDEDKATVTLDLNYDLSVNKNVVTAGPYRAGDNITFDIVVNNDGTVDANNIEVSDLPNTGLVYVSSSFTNNVTETSQGVWVVGGLSGGSSETITVVYQVEPDYTGTSVVNNIRITADDGNDIDSDPNVGPEADDLDDGIDDDDEDEVTLTIEQTYDLSMVKVVTSSGPYGIGSTVDYAITISNDGTLPASNIEFTDTPTSSLLFQSDDSGANQNITNIGVGLYQVATLAPGDSETLNLTFQIDPQYSGGPVGNIAEITADDGDDVDSDPDSGSDTDDLSDGAPDDDESNASVDVLVNGSIGDFVFEDTNGNGVQDFGEVGFPGVRINLFNINGFIVDTQVTDGGGNYLFENVPPGNYYIELEFPAGFANTFPNQGGDDTADSDLDNSNGPGTTAIINLGAGENDVTVDLGINECISIGEVVWLDYNENDLLDPNENGINGIRVELFRQDANGSYVLWDVDYTGHKPGTPSDDGYYKFCVSPGTYYLRFVNPPLQLVPVVPNFGINENTDSDVTGMFGSGTTDNFTVVSGQDRCDIGAGFYTMGTIGDFVWLDDNGNGMRESNERGLEGVIVRAINDSGEEVATAVSDDEGNYMLDYLTKSNMYLKFESPDGYQFTQANMGSDEALDSDVDGSNGANTTKFYPINPGTHVPHIDAGLTYKVLSIEWSQFTGEHVDTYNNLDWIVKSDTEISHFSIERSFGDITNFSEISKVLSSTSETSGENQYNYKDYDVVESGIYYYRIIQKDINGDVEVSKVISIEVSDRLADKVVLYPNPVVEELVVSVDSDQYIENFDIQLYDNLGKLIKSNLLADQSIRAGKNLFYVNVTDVPDGMYSVKINLDQEVVFKKLIILKQ